MEIKISREVRSKILEKLLKESSFISFFEERERLINFLSEIFPLETMPSEDPRHKNAKEDFTRHLIVNDDWAINYVFKERLNLINQEDSVFVKFIELLISPEYQVKIDSIHNFVTLFSIDLACEGLRFILTGYKNNLPIYKLSPETGPIKNIPRDVKKNDIIFFLKTANGFSHKITGHSKPTVFPSFVLTKDNWDDYGAKTLHHLFFYPEEEKVFYIGAIKIMERGEESTQLPKEFFLLNENYCSLGMGEEFYQQLREKAGNDFTSILFALRDTAFFPMIYEEFEDEEVFKNSLARDDQTERNSRTVAYTFAGGNLEEKYKFKYKFKPLFDEKETEIDFPFTSSGEIPKRIIALIGKNGTGKTQILTSLAKNLSDRSCLLFSPQTPVFGKVLAVSYSVFDTFEIPQSDNSFNYKYCGLKDFSGKLLSEVELEKRFYESAEKIKRKKRIAKLYRVLENFIDTEIIELLIKEDNSNIYEFLKINLEDFSNTKQKLSSGQSLLLYIVVEILAELRFDSLILFDEPETHLHPNAITQLISAIYNLVEQFDSYCIIATHSPIIIQSLTSDSVYITEKEEGVFSIKKIYTESFGENLSNITDEVFGNRDVFQEYKKIINSFIKVGKNYEEIVGLLESSGVPLSLNVKIYIRSMIKT